MRFPSWLLGSIIYLGWIAPAVAQPVVPVPAPVPPPTLQMGGFSDSVAVFRPELKDGPPSFVDSHAQLGDPPRENFAPEPGPAAKVARFREPLLALARQLDGSYVLMSRESVYFASDDPRHWAELPVKSGCPEEYLPWDPVGGNRDRLFFVLRKDVKPSQLIEFLPATDFNSVEVGPRVPESLASYDIATQKCRIVHTFNTKADVAAFASHDVGAFASGKALELTIDGGTTWNAVTTYYHKGDKAITGLIWINTTRLLISTQAGCLYLLERQGKEFRQVWNLPPRKEFAYGGRWERDGDYLWYASKDKKIYRVRLDNGKADTQIERTYPPEGISLCHGHILSRHLEYLYPLPTALHPQELPDSTIERTNWPFERAFQPQYKWERVHNRTTEFRLTAWAPQGEKSYQTRFVFAPQKKPLWILPLKAPQCLVFTGTGDDYLLDLEKKAVQPAKLVIEKLAVLPDLKRPTAAESQRFQRLLSQLPSEEVGKWVELPKEKLSDEAHKQWVLDGIQKMQKCLDKDRKPGAADTFTSFPVGPYCFQSLLDGATVTLNLQGGLLGTHFLSGDDSSRWTALSLSPNLPDDLFRFACVRGDRERLFFIRENQFLYDHSGPWPMPNLSLVAYDVATKQTTVLRRVSKEKADFASREIGAISTGRALEWTIDGGKTWQATGKLLPEVKRDPNAAIYAYREYELDAIHWLSPALLLVHGTDDSLTLLQRDGAKPLNKRWSVSLSKTLRTLSGPACFLRDGDYAWITRGPYAGGIQGLLTESASAPHPIEELDVADPNAIAAGPMNGPPRESTEEIVRKVMKLRERRNANLWRVNLETGKVETAVELDFHMALMTTCHKQLVTVGLLPVAVKFPFNPFYQSPNNQSDEKQPANEDKSNTYQGIDLSSPVTIATWTSADGKKFERGKPFTIPNRIDALAILNDKWPNCMLIDKSGHGHTIDLEQRTVRAAELIVKTLPSASTDKLSDEESEWLRAALDNITLNQAEALFQAAEKKTELTKVERFQWLLNAICETLPTISEPTPAKK